MAESNAVKKQEEPTGVARLEDSLTEEGKAELKGIQQRGALSVSKARELTAISKQVAGMTWGSGNMAVKGTDLPPASQYAIAQIVKLTGANLSQHIYILGGRPYLNAEYWAERIAGEPHFVRWEQRNLSASHIEHLRKLAEQADADGDHDDAIRLRREARELSSRRSHYNPPAWATDVYETIIYRYREIAPLSAIQRGQAPSEAWIETVNECNWAGGRPKITKTRQNGGGTYESDPDPVGNAEPAKTARSRSLRRCAIRAFATTLAPVERELQKLEDAIEADFEIIYEDRAQERKALPSETGEQAIRTGNGEPGAAAPREAQSLPVQELGTRAKASAESQELRQAREHFNAGCNVLGVGDTAKFCQDTLGRLPSTVEDYQRLNSALNEFADGAGNQEGLPL
jgi:hypothetical protein